MDQPTFQSDWPVLTQLTPNYEMHPDRWSELIAMGLISLKGQFKIQPALNTVKLITGEYFSEPTDLNNLKNNLVLLSFAIWYLRINVFEKECHRWKKKNLSKYHVFEASYLERLLTIMHHYLVTIAKDFVNRYLYI